MGKWVQFDDLPDETQDDIIGEIEERFDVEHAVDELGGLVKPPMFYVHDMPIRKITGYRRTPSMAAVKKFVRMLKHSEAPPILVSGNKFIDGGHRFAAYVEAGRETIPVIDVGRLFKMWPEWAQGGADELERVASREARIANRIVMAYKQPFDMAKIAKYRKDFLMLMKNIGRVHDYDEVQIWASYVSKWSRDLDAYLYRYLIEDLKNMRFRKEISESDWKYWDKRIREETWGFVIDMRVPISRADDYWTKEARFNQYEREVKTWERKVRAQSRKAWRVLRDFVDWYVRQNEGSAPVVDVPQDEKISVEGLLSLSEGMIQRTNSKRASAY